jgi:hypothetical protein
MPTNLFSTELASLNELAERWDVALHQLSYIVRSRRIPFDKTAGTTRLFSRDQQQRIYAVMHGHIVEDDGEIALTPVMRRLAEEEELLADQLMERVEKLEAENADLKAQLVQLEADLGLLMRRQARESEQPTLTPAQTILDEQLVWLTQQVNDMGATLRDAVGKVGGLAVIMERRVQFLEAALGGEAGDDEALAEARQRGRDFLAATEGAVAVQAADHIRHQGA